MTDPFPGALARLPSGYGEGTYEGARWGVTRRISADGRQEWLYGEELGGAGRVSCNVYRLRDGRVLVKPCEMPEAVVRAFVAGFIPQGAAREGARE